MLPSRRFAGDKTPIRATEWNQVIDQSRRTGVQQTSRPIDVGYSSVTGRNDCGYDLVPGSPVVLQTFTADQASPQLGNWKKGWVSLRPCYMPRTIAESNALLGSLFSIGIVLDGIAQNATGEVAVSGIVECNCTTPGSGWVRPLTQATTDHRSRLMTHPTWGVARHIRDTGPNMALIDLNASSNRIFYSLRQRMQIPVNATLANFATSTEVFYVQDAYAIAQWQANEDLGEAMLLTGNRWHVVNPWCVDDTAAADDPLQIEPPVVEEPPP